MRPGRRRLSTEAEPQLASERGNGPFHRVDQGALSIVREEEVEESRFSQQTVKGLSLRSEQHSEPKSAGCDNRV